MAQMALLPPQMALLPLMNVEMGSFHIGALRVSRVSPTASRRYIRT